MTFEITTYGMTNLGYKIFLDRYALKKLDTLSLRSDRLVLVKVNDVGHKELAKVLVTFDVGDPVDLVLEDGTMIYEVPLDQVDVPLEYDPSQMFDRVASAVASAEKEDIRDEWTVKFRELLVDWKFVPAGRILASAGTNSDLAHYNCYVLPNPEDSKSGILNTLEKMSYIMSSGGGVGINISTIRPQYARTYSTNGRSSGAVSWGELYSFVTGLIEQGGSRRGALMIILDVWHPDVEEFIEVKKDMSRYNNANISIGITDGFMEAVKNDDNWDLIFPDTTLPKYDTIWDGDLYRWRTKRKMIWTEEQQENCVKIYKTVKAKDLWDKIIDAAWSSAEPGLVFLDTANEQSNSQYYNKLIATNPCAEEWLPAWGACLLGSLNLSKFVGNLEHIGYKGVNWESLGETIKTAVRFLDNVIDVTPYQYGENRRQQKSERRIGLGTMGLAEVLIKLGLRYGSEESLEFIDSLYEFITETAYNASIDLALEKGPFPEYDRKYVNTPFVNSLDDMILSRIHSSGIRNVTILSQAPTGTIGTMVDTSTGIEPYYAWEYERTTRLGNYKQQVKPYQEFLELYPKLDIIDEIVDLPDYFVTAMEISPEDHVKVLATVQKWIDSAVSKTCNLPNDATREDISKIYQMMYDLNCKGGTIYRDGSRDVQVLNVETGDKKFGPDRDNLAEEFGDSYVDNFDLPEGFGKGMPNDPPVVERDIVLSGKTFKIRNSFGNCFVTINFDNDGNPFEVFVNVGKAGSDIQADAEAIGRLISLILRISSDVSQITRLQEIFAQLRGIGSGRSFGFGEDRVCSVPDSIAKALEMFMYEKEADRLLLKESMEKLRNSLENVGMEEYEKVPIPDEVITAGFREEALGNACPDCGNFTFIRTEGCKKCENCGYSEC